MKATRSVHAARCGHQWSSLAITPTELMSSVVQASQQVLAEAASEHQAFVHSQEAALQGILQRLAQLRSAAVGKGDVVAGQPQAAGPAAASASAVLA